MKKRLLAWVLSFALALSLLPVGVLAAGETPGWQEAYQEYIQSDFEETTGGYGGIGDPKEYTQYFLFDVNGDEVPELWIDYSVNAWGDRLCSYVDGKVIEGTAYGALSYIPGKSLVLTSGGQNGQFLETVVRLENGVFDVEGQGELWIVNDSGQVVDNPEEYRYAWNGQSVDIDTYEQNLNAVFDTSQAVEVPQNGGQTYQEILDTLDTSKIPPEKLYKQILDKYKTGVDEKWTIQEFMDNGLCYLCGYDPEEVGYTFIDIDGNGIKELLIGDAMEDPDYIGMIYALYSYTEGNVEEVFSSIERARYGLCEGNAIYNDGSSGALNSVSAYYRLSGTTLSLIERVVYDGYTDKNNPYFYGTTENDEDLVSITEEQAQKIKDSYVKKSIEYTSFAEYGAEIETPESSSDDLIKQYIKEHIEYANSNKFKNEIVAGYGPQLSAILNDVNQNSSISSYNFLSDIKDIVNLELDNFDTTDEYELLLAQILFEGIAKDSVEENYQQYYADALLTLGEALLKTEEFSKSISSETREAILAVISMIENSKPGSVAFNDANGKLFDILSGYDTVSFSSSFLKTLEGSGLDFLVGFTTETLETVCGTTDKLLMYLAAGEAYTETAKSFADLVLDMRRSLGIWSDDTFFNPVTQPQITEAEIFSAIGYDPSNNNYNDSEDVFAPVHLFQIANALENFYTGIVSYEEGNAKSIANRAIEEMASGVGNSLVKSSADTFLDLLSGLPVIREYQVLKTLLSSGMFAVDTLTNVDDQSYLGATLLRLCALSYILQNTVNNTADALLDWQLPPSSYPQNESEDLEGYQLERAVVFDDAINMYKSLISLASSYAVRYVEECLIAANESFSPLNWNKKEEISWYSTAISVAMAQKISCEDIHCHTIGLEYDNQTGMVTYSDKNLNVYTIACPVDVIVKSNTGEQIAFLSDSGNRISSGYENYFFTVNQDSDGESAMKVAIVPKSYQVILKGTDSGTMNAYVANMVDNEIVDIAVFYEIPVTNGAEGIFVPTQQDDKAINLIFDDETYMPSSEELPSQPAPPETPEQPAEPFTDVDENDWFYDEVVYVYENGLMTGVGGNRFAPNTATNRAMLATILYRLAGEPDVSGDMPFTDVETGTWYTDAVLWAAQNGIVNGVDEGIFAPMNTLTREQLVTMLHRYAEAEGYDVSAAADLSGYPDAGKVLSYAQKAMSWAVAEGIVAGMDDGTLNPAGNATRAQIATILMRFCEGVAQ